MKKKISLLMIDDHPFILEAYKNTLNGFKNDKYEIVCTEAENAKMGYEMIMDSNNSYNVAFLDISIPPYPEKNIASGEDLAKLVREKMPNCMIFLLTMHTEKLKTSNIYNEVNPEALIIKNDLTFEELISAFDQVINGGRYLSKSVVKMFEENNNDSTNN